MHFILVVCSTFRVDNIKFILLGISSSPLLRTPGGIDPFIGFFLLAGATWAANPDSPDHRLPELPTASPVVTRTVLWSSCGLFPNVTENFSFISRNTPSGAPAHIVSDVLPKIIRCFRSFNIIIFTQPLRSGRI